MSIGVPELLMAGPLLVLLIGPVLGLVVLFRMFSRRRAKRYGYPSALAYLRAAPRTDEERRDAANLAIKGLVICLLGMIFPPVVLIGLVPLYYGGRKLAYASMGLGLVDDGEEPRA